MEVNETNRPLTETPMEQPIEAPVPTVEDTEKETSAPKQTLEEVVQRLKEINEKNDLTDKQEIDSLKQTFYKLQKAKSEAARKAFIDEGGKAEDFTPETGNTAPLDRPGYSKEFLQELVKATGERYKMKELK